MMAAYKELSAGLLEKIGPISKANASKSTQGGVVKPEFHKTHENHKKPSYHTAARAIQLSLLLYHPVEFTGVMTL